VVATPPVAPLLILFLVFFFKLRAFRSFLKLSESI